MIIEIFTWLNNALNSNPFYAILAAFIWGILSIILSPCHLTSIPLIVGFIEKQGKTSVKNAFWLSLLFSTGILITIVIIGIITALLGRIMGDIGSMGNYFIAIIFLLVGLYLLDIIPAPWTGTTGTNLKYKGLFTALIIGLIFGIGVGPCTFAYMAPILGIAFNVANKQLLLAIALLVSFGIAHCSVIILAGTLTEKVQLYLNWTDKTKSAIILRKICGVLVIIGSIYLIFK